jgi:exonuclease SbcC
MRINRLRLVNFRQHECTELELGAGLTGIIGPNGAGKTTLLEAIAWVMYGMKAARGSRESIRRRGAPPRSRVEVEMEFTLGPHHYRVLRGLNSAELYQDGAAVPIANSLEAVSDRITRLLGMSRDEFFNTYFTGQKELAVMASMSAPERAQFLSRVLGYERIRAAQERIKEQRTALRSRLAALQAALPDPQELDAEETRARERERNARGAQARAEAAAKAAGERAAGIRPRWEALEQGRERSLALESDRRVLAAQREGLEAGAERLRRQAAEAEAARVELDRLAAPVASLAPLREQAARLDGEAAAFHAQRAAVGQLAEVRARVAEIEVRTAGLAAPQASAAAARRTNDVRARLTALAAEADERRTAWVRDRQDAETKQQALRDQYVELREQRKRVVEAGREGACPTCARPLGAEFENVLGILDRQMEAIGENGKYFRQRVTQLEAEPAELESVEARRVRVEQELAEAVAAQARAEAEVAERKALAEERKRLAGRAAALEATAGAVAAAYDAERHAALRQEIAALEPLALKAERLRDAASRAASLREELAQLEISATELAQRLAGVGAQIVELAFSEPVYLALRQEMQGAERDLRSAEVGLVRTRSEREAAAESLEALMRRREEVAARRREAREVGLDLALHQELDRALSDLRTDLNQALRPELSELASAFVRDLTNARYTELELDEDYMATLLDEGDPKAVISGGEEDIANLALRLAISQMIAERAGQPLSLLVLDEIFGSLDEERRASVVELLRGLADRFPQVILITHIDSVRDGFDRVIRVGYDVGRGVAVVSDEQAGAGSVAA